MRQASWSLVPLAKCGFNKVGACHQSALTSPPPPRLVGLNVHLVCACATPADASIWAASGGDTPATALRNPIGITPTCWTSMSFRRMNNAARFTGSISLSAAFQMRSYSSLRHRVVLRRAHLFSLEQISIDVKFDMNVWGSGAFGPTLYIWRSE